MSNIDPYAYTITIQKVEVDGESVFEATIAELPDAADYADSFNEAYALAIQTIEGAAELFAESGREFPKPQKHEKEYSGRVTLRMPKTLHARADNVADKEGVSLNQFLVSVIAERVGFSTACNQLIRFTESYFMQRAYTAAKRMGDNLMNLSGSYDKTANSANYSMTSQMLSAGALVPIMDRDSLSKSW